MYILGDARYPDRKIFDGWLQKRIGLILRTSGLLLIIWASSTQPRVDLATINIPNATEAGYFAFFWEESTTLA